MSELKTVYTLLKTYGFLRPKPGMYAPVERVEDILCTCSAYDFGYLVERELDNIRFPDARVPADRDLVVWIVRQLEMTYEGDVDELWEKCEQQPLKNLKAPEYEPTVDGHR